MPTATIVFKSGAAIEVEVGAQQADDLQGAFYTHNADPAALIGINLLPTGNKMNLRVIDVSAIFIDDSAGALAEEDEDEDEDEDD